MDQTSTQKAEISSRLSHRTANRNREQKNARCKLAYGKIIFGNQRLDDSNQQYTAATSTPASGRQKTITHTATEARHCRRQQTMPLQRYYPHAKRQLHPPAIPTHETTTKKLRGRSYGPRWRLHRLGPRLGLGAKRHFGPTISHLQSRCCLLSCYPSGRQLHLLSFGRRLCSIGNGRSRLVRLRRF